MTIRSLVRYASAAASLAALVGVGAAVPAQAASTHVTKHCDIVLGTAKTKNEAAPVVSRTCTTSAAQAVRSAKAIANSSVLTVTAWTDANYQGDSYSWYTQESGCGGHSGITVNYVGDAMNDKISSLKMYGSCNFMVAHADANMEGDMYYISKSSSYVGDSLNDRMSSFTVMDFSQE